jgi:uncharacterized protein YjiS (DUF1127 family)
MLMSIGHKIRFESSFLGQVWAVAARIAEMRHAVEGRRAIARMDGRMLSDIGLSRGEALEEVSRRPWDTGPKNLSGEARR